MKKTVIAIAFLSVALMSCKERKKEKAYLDMPSADTEVAITTSLQTNEGYTLMKTNCYVCHNPNTASHDDIIAPPFAAVKRRYSKQYSTKKEFTNALVDWVQNPDEEKALMRSAVNKFKVMPKMDLDSEVLQKIGDYLYDNEPEQPEWFEAHMNEKHGAGKRKH